MRVRIATKPGDPNKPNEDWAGGNAYAAVVLDGLSEADETGCVHGTHWYVHQLGTYLLELMSDVRVTLTNALGEAISRVAADHAGTCDLAHPGTPCSTVAMVRLQGETMEYLVLSDSLIVFEQSGEPLVITDRGVTTVVSAGSEHLSSPTEIPDRRVLFERIRQQQKIRNQPGGYWVAQVNPDSAAYAHTGSVTTRHAVLLSDGAALPVTDFGMMSWRDLLDNALSQGPARLIDITREYENQDPYGIRWPRYKRHDDATAVVCDVFTDGPP